jgi:hypothetical protein
VKSYPGVFARNKSDSAALAEISFQLSWDFDFCPLRYFASKTYVTSRQGFIFRGHVSSMIQENLDALTGYRGNLDPGLSIVAT